VSVKGLEPSQNTLLEPKPSASTNSATPTKNGTYRFLMPVALPSHPYNIAEFYFSVNPSML